MHRAGLQLVLGIANDRERGVKVERLMAALAALGIKLGLHAALPGQRLDPADELVACHWHSIGRKRPADKSQSTGL